MRHMAASSLDGTAKLAPSFGIVGWFADDIETYETVGKLPRRAISQHSLESPALAHRAGRDCRSPSTWRICRDEGTGERGFRRAGNAGDAFQLFPG